MAVLTSVKRLAAANALLLFLLIAHTVDHVSRPASGNALAIGVPALLTFAGTIVALGLAFRSSGHAAAAAVAAGFVNLAGFTLVHVLPHWSIFSEPYSSLQVNALSWALLVAPMAAAALLFALGLRELGMWRRQSRPAV